MQTLKAASPPDEDFDRSIAQLPDNMEKNRTKLHLPGMGGVVVMVTLVILAGILKE